MLNSCCILESLLAPRQPVNVESTVQGQGPGRRGQRGLARKMALRHSGQ